MRCNTQRRATREKGGTQHEAEQNKASRTPDRGADRLRDDVTRREEVASNQEQHCRLALIGRDEKTQEMRETSDEATEEAAAAAAAKKKQRAQLCRCAEEGQRCERRVDEGRIRAGGRRLCVRADCVEGRIRLASIRLVWKNN